MGRILAFTFSETVRSRLGLILAITNWVCVLTSLGLIGVGVYIKIAVEEFTNLVKDYNGSSLPYYIVTLGMLSAAVNGGGGFICFMIADPKKRKFYKFFLLGYVIAALCVCFCVMVGGAMCYGHISHLSDSFHGGLMVAMSEYRTDAHLKAEMDKLQMRFQCCGSTEYTEWFTVPWIPEEYLTFEQRELQELVGYSHDDVPFSCCSPKAHRPCIHNNVHDNAAHFNYDYITQLTLYREGCRDKLMSYFGDELLVEAGAFVLIIFALQLLIVIVVRYLQTSVFEVLKLDEPDMPSPGYLFAFGAAPEAEAKVKGSKDDDDDDDDEGSAVAPLLPQASRSGSRKHYRKPSRCGSKYAEPYYVSMSQCGPPPPPPPPPPH